MKNTTEEIIEAYKKYGSVWKAADLLEMSGQAVWERLRNIQYPLMGRQWTKEEYVELERLAGEWSIGQIAQRLGRPYAGVAQKISRRGLSGKYSGSKAAPIPKGRGFDKKNISKLIKRIDKENLTIRKIGREEGINTTNLVTAIQKYSPGWWLGYTKKNSDLSEEICPNCSSRYYPLTKRQTTCSTLCTRQRRVDKSYFGGKRKNTIGLAEKICQLCQQKTEKGLSSHHVLGKENDLENEALIALCRGCHKLVTLLASRRFIYNSDLWENLLHLAIQRNIYKFPDATQTYVSVDVELLNDNEEVVLKLPLSSTPESKETP